MTNIRTYKRLCCLWLPDEGGNSLIELALVLPVLILILVAAVDFGRAYFVSIQLASAAQAGALYGTLTPTDLTGIVSAANRNAIGVPSVTTTATFGCECSEGTKAVAACTAGPTCTYNVVNYVSVVTSAAYTSILRYPGIPKTLVLSSRARIRSAQ